MEQLLQKPACCLPREVCKQRLESLMVGLGGLWRDVLEETQAWNR